MALLIPLALVAAGAASQVLFIAGLALFAVAGVSVLLDVWRAPRRAALSAAREHDEILSVGVANHVTVRIGAHGAAWARVRDECAPLLHPSLAQRRLRIPALLEYTVTPQRRGIAAFGNTLVRVDGPLRLGWRQHSVGQAESVRIDADLTAVRAYEALARRGQLAELGLRTMRLRSEGTEFERIRDAVPDDPLRAVNWRATARTGRLMATELIPERAQPLIVCIDHGRLMGVGAGELTKLDHAINAALLLVHVALRSGDRAGLLAFADTVTATLAPRAGNTQLKRFLDVVRPLQPAESEADYDDAFAYLSRWQTRRSLLVIFTDVLDPDQARALLGQCARLRRRHLPLVVTVRDPALDDTARLAPRRGADAYARAVAGGLIADREDTLTLMRHSGVDTVDADARTLSPRVVNRYLDLKRTARL